MTKRISMLKQFLAILFAVLLAGIVLIFIDKQFVETQHSDSELRTNNKTKLQLCMDRIEAEL